MSRQPRSLFDELLELAVYVPAGLAAKVLDQIPELADTGRRRVGGQIAQARVIGRFAVGLARSQARRTFATPARPRPRPGEPRPGEPRPGEPRPGEPRRGEPRRESTGPATSGPPRPEPAPGRAEEAPAPEPPHPNAQPGSGRSRPNRARRPDSRARAGAPKGPSEEAPTPPEAIPDYDALAASQVVPRLQGLDRDELGAVERYEAATRGRRTILNRVAQLQRALDED